MKRALAYFPFLAMVVSALFLVLGLFWLTRCFFFCRH